RRKKLLSRLGVTRILQRPSMASTAPVLLAAGMTVAALGAGIASAAPLQEGGSALKNGTIGYVLTERHWSVYETDVDSDCPEGLNEGPREQFKKLYPEDGIKRTVLEAQLKREGEQWHPTKEPEAFKFHEVRSRVS